MAEVATVPVRIKNLTDAEVLEAQLVDLQRRDVHPMKLATGFRALPNLEEPKYSIEPIAAKTGKSSVYMAAYVVNNIIELMLRSGLCGEPRHVKRGIQKE